MSNENVKKFYEEVKKSPEMVAKINELNQGTKEEAEKAIVEFAASKGFEFTIDDLHAAAGKLELDDDEIESIAGGGKNPALGRYTRADTLDSLK